MTLKISTTAFVLSTIFATQLSAKDFMNLSDFPQWFQDAMNQEVEVKKTSSLKLEAFNVDGTVKGELSLSDGEEGYWYYSINIGKDSPVECHVFKEHDGPVTVLNRVFEHNFEYIAKANKKELTNKFNYAIDNGVIKNTPYVQFDVLYNLGQGNEKVVGLLKGLVAETQNSLQVCIHNNLGYRKTFYNVFESFIEAFIENEKSDAFFETVYQMAYNGIPVGYGAEKYHLDADGDIGMEMKSTFVFPVDQHSVAYTDSTQAGWSRPDGTLINAGVTTFENGELTSDFSFQRKEDKWHVDGQLQGKELATVLEYDGPVLSNIGSYFTSSELAKSEEDTREMTMWLPDADPTSVLTVTLHKIKGKEGINRRMDMGPMTMHYLVDENGIIQKGNIDQGPIAMDIAVSYAAGAPKLP